jgi:hypothetical protein
MITRKDVPDHEVDTSENLKISYTMGTGSLSLRVKWAGHGVDHPPSS